MDVLVRGIPPEVHAALTDRAKAQQVSLRAYIVDRLSTAVAEPGPTPAGTGAVSVAADPVPAAIPPELLAMPGVLADLAAVVKRIEARQLAPVEDLVADARPDANPDRFSDPRPPSPEPSTVERWLADGWPVKRARNLLGWLDLERTLTDADLTEKMKRCGVSRGAYDAARDQEVTGWLAARGEPTPADPARARATFAAELRDALGDPLPDPAEQ